MSISPRTMMACLFAASLTAACGPTFQAANHSSTEPTKAGDPTSPIGDETKIPTDNIAWKELQFQGSVNGPRFDKTSAVELDKVNKELIVRLPMFANIYLDGTTLNLPIEKLPGARLGLEPLANGGSALVLRIPLRYVVKGVDLGNPAKLPNGDPLPSVPSGELPTVGLEISKQHKIQAALYLAPSVVGLFISTPFDPYLGMTLPIRNASKTKTFGYFSTIPAKKGVADGGFFVSVALPPEIARLIDDNL